MLNTVKKGRPAGLYASFDRKVGKDKKTTHYCPGCSHGIIQKLVAEALVDLGIQDRTIFISPVGCSVFAYYYMDAGNVQAPHGRAPAVGTGLARSRPESIVISYQGDGDLAAIGTAEIIHAANRGENMTVIFVNNAIYGMTGGQMAPTTMVSQKTLTSPRGRTVLNDGFPIRMSEIMASLGGPVYVERTACTNSKNIMRTRKAIRKALTLQIQKKGFSFVEILSACPTNWKMTPKDSVQWIQDVLEPYFKLGVLKDESETREPIVRSEPTTDPAAIFEAIGLKKGNSQISLTKRKMPELRIKTAGFGGQGALTAGAMLAEAGMNDGLNASWIPSYGPEMRGGTANCSVILSDQPVGTPIVKNPDILIAMNGPSLDAFEADVVKDGLIIVNSSIVSKKVTRTDVHTIYAPLTDIAAGLGLKAAANSVAVGVLIGHNNLFDRERIYQVLRTSLKKKTAVETNIKAVDAGFAFAQGK
ncbi:2-oxoacid:acceptor oxidoreductase family protein [Bdellovibrionota bacterium FG-1]